MAGAALAAMALSLTACSSSSSSSGGGSSSSSLSGTLNASGSTLQLVYQQAAIQAFKSVQSGMTVNYGGGGSGKGRTDLASGVVQFAGSDSPIPSDEVSNFKGKTVLYYPILISPITVSYNLSGVTGLKLTAPVIADIFQAKITKWNDSAITALNPGVKLPSTPITIAHRSDSSGTTANFSQFLVEGAPGVWKLGSSSTISWPATSRGGNGNGGVAQIVKSTPGAIGYVDYADAKASGLTYASIKNQAGNYVAPSVSGGHRRRRQRHRQARPDVQRDLGARRQLLPDHCSVMGAGLPEAIEREHHEDAQGVLRLPGRGRPETAPGAGLRAAALQHRPEGQGAAQQDRFVIERVMSTAAHVDQIGWLS